MGRKEREEEAHNKMLDEIAERISKKVVEAIGGALAAPHAAKDDRPAPVPRPGLSLDPRTGFFSSTTTDHFAAITAEIEKLESQPDRIHAANALRAVRRTLERAEGTDG